MALFLRHKSIAYKGLNLVLSRLLGGGPLLGELNGYNYHRTVLIEVADFELGDMSAGAGA